MIQPDLLPLSTPVESLTLMPGNPRRGDVEAVAASLEAFGQRKPIVARRFDRVVIAGNHTLQAARSLGWPFLAVVWTDDDEATGKAYSLADNRTAELGSYDEAELATMIGEVAGASPELLAATGWTDEDLAKLVDGLEQAPAPVALVDPDEVPEPPADPVTKAGDVWLLGDHRLLCGDCREPGDVARVLAGATINVAVTSPPYAEQRTYDEASAFRPIPPDEYVEWFAAVAANVAAHLADDGSWFVNIKPSISADGLDTLTYVFDLVLAHVRQWGWHWATEFCWERNGVPKSVTRRFKNQFEPVYQFARGEWKMRAEAMRHASAFVPMNVGPGGGNTAWNDRQGSSGGAFGPPSSRPRRSPINGEDKHQGQGTGDDVGQFIGEGLAFPGNRLPTFQATHEAVGHAAAYPVGLPAWFIRAYSDAGDAIFDPFMGSGSTRLNPGVPLPSRANHVAVGPPGRPPRGPDRLRH